MAIDTTLAANPNTNLLGPFSSTDANLEPPPRQKYRIPNRAIFRVFLERDLMPVESCTLLRNTIVERGLEFDCFPITDSLRIYLTLKTGDEKLPLTILRPTAPLANLDLLWYRHHMLTHQLPGLDPNLKRLQGSLIP